MFIVIVDTLEINS